MNSTKKGGGGIPFADRIQIAISSPPDRQNNMPNN